ncbi:MAG: NADH-quinone oxidoreductase subunit NuoH [Candidatus Dormibacteria bacterium]
MVGAVSFWGWVGIVVLKAVIILIFVATAAAYMSYAERKVSARIQLRRGPNRVGPLGLLQPLADVVKLFFKENTAPKGRERFLFLLAPSIAGSVAIFAFAAIPVNGPTTIGSYTLHWDLIHVNVGLLFILAMTSLGVYSLFLGGYAANSKYSLLGGLRSAAQLVSYEMAVAFAIMGVVILSGSLDLEQIVMKQSGLWFIFVQPLAFFLYFIAGLAEGNRLPFDLPEAESELGAGYHTEYSSMRFAFYFLAEYINMVIICSIATTLFLGGWLPPFAFLSFVPGVIWYLVKIAVLLFTMIWIRFTLPRFRYDRLMNFGWKVLLPLGLANIIVTGVVIALRAA